MLQHDFALLPQLSPQPQPSAQSQPGQLQLVQLSPSQSHSTHWQSGPQQQTTWAASGPASEGREAAVAITIIATTASNRAGKPRRVKIRDMENLLCLLKKRINYSPVATTSEIVVASASNDPDTVESAQRYPWNVRQSVLNVREKENLFGFESERTCRKRQQ